MIESSGEVDSEVVALDFDNELSYCCEDNKAVGLWGLWTKFLLYLLAELEEALAFEPFLELWNKLSVALDFVDLYNGDNVYFKMQRSI